MRTISRRKGLRGREEEGGRRRERKRWKRRAIVGCNIHPGVIFSIWREIFKYLCNYAPGKEGKLTHAILTAREKTEGWEESPGRGEKGKKETKPGKKCQGSEIMENKWKK